MELLEAAKKAMDDPKVMSLGNYFLASAFSIIEQGNEVKEWTLLFYNPHNNMARDCIVNDKGVELRDEQPAQREMKKADIPAVKIEINKALEIAYNRYNKKSVNVLISLHTPEKTIWTITMIGVDISATTYDIDIESGDIIREETTSLMRGA